MIKISLFLSILTLLVSSFADAQVRNDITPAILPLKERAEVKDRWTEYRLDHLVPELMRREGIIYPNTAHSIELNAEVFIPEWNRNILIMLEEDAIFDGEKVWYIYGRMEEFYLTPRQK